MDLTPDERGRLAATAAARARRQAVWVFGGAVVFVAVVAVLPTIVTGDRIGSPLDLAVLAAPLVVFLVLLAALSLRLRRRPKQWPLAVGADRQTRAAVRRAIRVGYSADRRVDALVRDLRDYQLRQRQEILVPVALTVLLCCLLLVLFDNLALLVIAACSLALVLAGAWQGRRYRRQLVAYRGLPDQAPTTSP